MTSNDAPERIWATGDRINGSWTSEEPHREWDSGAAEYVRADLAAQPAEAGRVSAAGSCATEGCENPAAWLFEAGNVISKYCATCYDKIATPPAAPVKGAVTVEAAKRAFDEIRELNMSGRDENGDRWANYDLIDQTVTEGLAALNALAGGRE